MTDLDAKAREVAAQHVDPAGIFGLSWQECLERAAAIITAYLQALPPQSPLGETGKPVAWRWRWGKMGDIDWNLSLKKPTSFAEDGYEVQPLYADRPGADRAAIIEECAKVADAAERDNPDAGHAQVAAAIRSLSTKESR